MRFVVVLSLIILPLSQRAEEPFWIRKPTLSFDEKTKKWVVEFETGSLMDVEVAVVRKTNSAVIRHLAAGVLGSNPPAPLLANSKTQRIEWDGNDDYGDPVDDGQHLAVRVRTGMGVELEQMVGGDPYAFFSAEMGNNDHSPWGINGLAAKPDGKVYVWGHTSNLGPPALRQYDLDGNYLKTLFPIPGGKDVEAMRGWGINGRADGTYTPKFNLLIDPSLTTTFLDTNLNMARLIPDRDPKRLTFWRGGLKAGSFDRMTVNSDGTVSEDPRFSGPLVKSPPFIHGPVEPGSHIAHSVLGPVFVCPVARTDSFYLSGIYAAKTRYGTVLEVKMKSPWRDGQVWKVDGKTRVAEPVFALQPETIPLTRTERVRAFGGSNGYSALHGVTSDKEGNIFICDRLNHRIVVLGKGGDLVAEIPVQHPDAIAISEKTGILYLTTRYGDYHRPGIVQLLKFADWRKDKEPQSIIELAKTGFARKQTHSHLVICDSGDGSNIWVASTQMPVRIYRDDAHGLRLLKDFYRVKGAQRALGFDRMQVDPVTDEVYVLDCHDSVWKVSDWSNPEFERVPIRTASIAIDSRRRHIYARTQRDGSSSNSRGKIARYHLDRENYPPANYGDTGTNRVTPIMQYEWCFEGNSDKGLAVAPNGNLAVVGDPRDGLRIFSGSETNVPWQGTKITNLPANAGGVRFDLAGNLYVGHAGTRPAKIPSGFEQDRHVRMLGKIYKFAPTGLPGSDNLFPAAPDKPSQTYDILYGAFETKCVTRSPRFGVDGFGRIYYPTNILPEVTVIDNNGNEILSFGTYGNRDATGGNQEIPLGFPNSVDSTDNYIYVADMVNLRILRLKKTFRATAISQ